MSRTTSLANTLRNTHFWGIAVLTAILAVVYYDEKTHLSHILPFIEGFLAEDNLHDLHRALLLIPMLYAAVVFQVRGAAIISFLCLGIVLPRAIFISPFSDALPRALVFVVLASLVTMLLGLERNRREKLEESYLVLDATQSDLAASMEQLWTSEERYRDLFQSASEAIIVSGPMGNIIEANRATTTLVGYSGEELQAMNIRQLLAGENPEDIEEIQSIWIKGGSAGKRCEERMLRNDGSEVIVELAARASSVDDRLVAVQTIARDVTEERRLRENMHFYIHEITRAQEEERKRIGRELHDETAQGLAVLAFDIERIARHGGNLPEEVLERLNKLRERTEALMEGVSRFSHELRPDVLEHLGLVPALEWLTDELRATTGIDASTQIIGKNRRLPTEVEVGLFRIAQEALNNVRRHSKAIEVNVRIEFGSEKVELDITDNGSGFKLPNMLGEFASMKQLGLLGMQERAHVLGGDFTIHSEEGKGTSVKVEVAA